MKKVINFLGRLAVCLLVLIFVQGLVFFGLTFEFERYNIVGWIAQGCAIIICIWAASEDWN
jgi:hypothetical protein